MTTAYPGPAGGGTPETAEGLPGRGPLAVPAPPPALKVGQAVTVHTASCESPEQHQRVALPGQVVHVYPDGAALARMADGSQLELCPWFTSDCANAVPAATEEAA